MRLSVQRDVRFAHAERNEGRAIDAEGTCCRPERRFAPADLGHRHGIADQASRRERDSVTMAIRIVLIDDHPLVLNGLEQLLQSGSEFKVVAACETAAAGIQAVASLRPDIVVLDLKLPDGDGFDVLRLLNPKHVGIVVLTASLDENEWLDAAPLGARAVVLKATAPRVLEECIRTVHAGGYELRVGDVDLSKRLTDRRAAE